MSLILFLHKKIFVWTNVTTYANKLKFCKFLSENLAIKIYRQEENLVKQINSSLWDLPSPSSITYFWNFGSTLGLCLAIQIVSGLFLTFHYTSYSLESFRSIAEIMREIWSGWIVRFVHINGASIFFVFIYLHLFRGMFYLRGVHKQVWASGVTIMVILIAISFLGYVLPWGQISYWAVAVITNLFSIIPIVGDDLVHWIWGGFSVGSPTLTRFYSLHFLLPFILTFLVLIHLVALHQEGSRNRVGINRNVDKMQFHPYFSVKDLSFILIVTVLFVLVSFYLPYILGDAVNNVPANPMQTPVHIQPEWYFLTSYAILRSLPRKSAGVIALFLSVGIFYAIPIFNLNFRTKFRSIRYIFFWSMLGSFFFLIKMGAMPAEEPYILLRKVFSVVYFSSIILLNV